MPDPKKTMEDLTTYLKSKGNSATYWALGGIFTYSLLGKALKDGTVTVSNPGYGSVYTLSEGG
jgi:hypothetical protein